MGNRTNLIGQYGGGFNQAQPEPRYNPGQSEPGGYGVTNPLQFTNGQLGAGMTQGVGGLPNGSSASPAPASNGGFTNWMPQQPGGGLTGGPMPAPASPYTNGGNQVQPPMGGGHHGGGFFGQAGDGSALENLMGGFYGKRNHAFGWGQDR